MMNPPMFTTHYDAIVVGARPAGAATALSLAQRGKRVLMIDRGRYGTDTTSTHALMRAAIVQLARWGVLPKIVASGATAITAANFIYNGEALRVPIKPRDGVAALYAPRRTVLDRLLVDAAQAAGVTVAYETTLVDVLQARNSRACGVTVRRADDRHHDVWAPWIIGADGRHSTLARLVNAPTTSHGQSFAANVYGYWKRQAAGEYRWYYAEGVSAGVIPTNDGQSCVFAALPAGQFPRRFGNDLVAGYRALLAEAAPDLMSLLGDDAFPDRLFGFAGMRGYLKQAAGPGWVLVGDAGYFKDPLTAHGLTDAMIEAEYVAAAVAEGTDAAVTAYAQGRDKRVGSLFTITDEIASFRWTLDEVRAMHKQLAGAMAEEVTALRAFTTEKAIA